MTDAAADRALAGLDDEQAAAVLAPPGPVRVMAGAGTGKTRTVTHRIAYQHLTGAVPAHVVLAVTHSAKAAGELRDRLARLGTGNVQARTFHAAAMRQLRYFWRATGLPGDGPVLLDVDGRGAYYRYLRGALAVTLRTSAGDLDAALVTDLATELTWAAARDLTADEYTAAAEAAGRRPGMALATVAGAMRRYSTAKRAAGVLDFADLLAVCARMLEEHEEVAAEVRRQYASFVVDEYQDTDPAQQRLLDAWLGGRDDLTVVGDARQAVYGFKGADTSLLTGFTARFPRAVTVDLVRDYRSTTPVVDTANRLMAGRPEATGPALVGMLGDGPAPRVVRCDDEDDEDAQVVATVRGWLDAGVAAQEIAVLHRFNAQAVKLTAALRDAGIPVVAGDGSAYFARREVAQVLALLRRRAAQAPHDDAAGVLDEALTRAGYDPGAPPDGTGAARERWDALDALRALVESLPEPLTRTLGALSADLDRRAAEDHVPPGRGAVTVTTIHKAKGLEWDACLLARATAGSLPSVYATTGAELAEERRLAYVAVTRARRHLVATWAAGRPGGRPARRSPYLDAFEPSAARRTRDVGPRTVVHPAAERFATGQRVTHDRHGLGKVVDVRAGKVTVDFGSAGRRTVAADTRLVAL
ncbi:ATP-dependent helicase [Cellulomonas wangsupingiae]|uniref:DNA 3'-5' helicase n=1 Tax=Cellulomonas wangsupingiae TaxID=2968085 RepID=A0ABY5K1U3_9CELL|nr:UvrD-helicase domain-containing protein [Cellulomonas wangsupingiae]MCC2335429.1 UvrD-helicase domain-containing protein [Cellulomonas wangsupingiae]UUI64396.1 UvrD-helicase domain-containing protein [Cellulomonas wangsupingiae]